MINTPGRVTIFFFTAIMISNQGCKNKIFTQYIQHQPMYLNMNDYIYFERDIDDKEQIALSFLT